MLTPNIDLARKIIPLRSDFILRGILADLKKFPFGDNKKEGKIIFSRSLESIFPSTYRKEQVDFAFSANESKDYRDILSRCFRDWIYIDADILRIHDAVLEEYSTFVSKVHPFCVLAYGIWEEYQYDNLLIKSQLFAKSVHPSGFSYEGKIKNFAENHMHLNGGEAFFNVLNDCISGPDLSHISMIDFEENKIPTIPDFPLINSDELKIGEVLSYLQKSILLCNRAMVYSEIGTPEEQQKEICSLFCTFGSIDKSYSFENLAHMGSFSINNELLLQAVSAYQESDTKKQYFLYMVALFDLAEQKPYLHQVVYTIIQCMNILRSYMVMTSNVGLTNFIDFFSSKLRKGEKKNVQETQSAYIRNVQKGGTTHLETKISPDSLDKKEIEKIIQGLDIKVDPRKNLHFSVHFLKKPDKRKIKENSLIVDVRYYSLRKEVKKNTRDIKHFLTHKQDILLQKKELFSGEMVELTEDIRHTIVSIDAAGQESLAPPEVFAPAIRELRKTGAFFVDGETILNTTPPHKKLRISYHIGEDFDSILTGLRRVDEAVSYLEMGKGDRFGHALALGIYPEIWADRNRHVYVKKLDLLDDFVWLRKQIEAFSLNSAHNLALSLETAVRQLSCEIYQKSYGWRDLYDMWRIRYEDPLMVFNENGANMLSSKTSAINKESKSLYKLYHTDLNVFKEDEKTILFVYDEGIQGFLSDIKEWSISYSLSFLNAIEEIQDCLMTTYAKKNIVIEVNPSSNSYICGDIRSYDEHPVFRWHPPTMELMQDTKKCNKYGRRNGIVPVCINTDDPGVFPTTLPNEFRLLREAAVKKGIDRKTAESWIEELRLFGLDTFEEITT